MEKNIDYKEQYEFFKKLYTQAALAHEEIYALCKDGATEEEIKKVERIALYNTRIEGLA